MKSAFSDSVLKPTISAIEMNIVLVAKLITVISIDIYCESENKELVAK
jgi:hypothetical protein